LTVIHFVGVYFLGVLGSFGQLGGCKVFLFHHNLHESMVFRHIWGDQIPLHILEREATIDDFLYLCRDNVMPSVAFIFSSDVDDFGLDVLAAETEDGLCFHNKIRAPVIPLHHIGSVILRRQGSLLGHQSSVDKWGKFGVKRDSHILHGVFKCPLSCQLYILIGA
jgi:hypothetical protein